MNKNNLFFLLSIISIALTSCSYNDESSMSLNPASSSDSSSETSNEINVIFSEFIVGKSYSNRAVEIANIGLKEVNLEEIKLNIYRSTSREITFSIPLKGKLGSDQTYVIAYNDACEEIKEKADLLSEDFLNDGSWAMTLTYKDTQLDIIGSIGFTYEYATELDLVRKKEYFISRDKFEEYDYVSYPYDDFSHLGNLDVISEEELMDGPKLTEEILNTPFCTSNSYGDGGAFESRFIRGIDGDTSYFDYGNQYQEFGVSGSLSTRYYGINCPEIAHSAGETSDPYGDEAKDYTNYQLKQAKHVILQSIKNYTYHETYGRMLAYIWVCYEDEAPLDHYFLLNFLIVREGYSNVAFVSSNSHNNEMTYKGLSYVDYLENAQKYATKGNLNIHTIKA